MTQGEKGATLSPVATFSRTSDPSARKASYEAVQKMDERKSGASASKGQQYGSWGPVFQNKAHFASMHLC